jgi:hypothetical protein
LDSTATTKYGSKNLWTTLLSKKIPSYKLMVINELKVGNGTGVSGVYKKGRYTENTAMN